MKSRKYKLFIYCFDTKFQADGWLDFINAEYSNSYYDRHYKKLNRIEFDAEKKRYVVYFYKYK